MKWLVKEFAQKTGVTVRTLHYYDEIGLLAPAGIDEQNGYRWYDEKSLKRMHEILFYRELDFPLSTIASILSSPEYDAKAALSEQKRLLALKKQHIEKLILAIEAVEKGNSPMAITNEYETERQRCADEARQRWGESDAYHEYESKTADYSSGDWEAASGGMEDIFREFALCMTSGSSPDSDEAKALAAELQRFITEHFYHCTDEILSGLGMMYCADERFFKNIDRHGIGTAQFASDAIRAYIISRQ